MEPTDNNSPRVKLGFFADSTNLLLIAIVIIITLLLGGIYFLIFRANKQTSTAANNAAQQKQAQAQITISPNWKTYKSTLGISVDYPENLKPVEDVTKKTLTFEVITNAAPFLSISIVSVPFTNSPKGNRTTESVQVISEWKEITVNGQTGHSYVKNPCPKDCTSFTVDLPYKNGAQILSITSITEDRNQFEEMVKRVKYTP